MDQLTQIMKVTGVPGKEFIQKLDSPEVREVQEREASVESISASSTVIECLLYCFKRPKAT